jgi:hypothetical protein
LESGRIFCAAWRRKKPGYRSNSSQTAPRFVPVFPLYPLRSQIAARFALGVSLRETPGIAASVPFLALGFCKAKA